MIQQNKGLARENARYAALRQENDWLREFLELKRERTDFSLVDAKVIAREGTNFESTFTIDKGSFHGIEKNMPVIADGNILIGVIVETGLTTARGITILSGTSSVGVVAERSGKSGILQGDFALFADRLCKIPQLPEDVDIVQGDNIYTSGLGKLYPAGLYIGEVTDIVPDPASYTLTALVKPSADILNLDRVMVITAFKQIYE